METSQQTTICPFYKLNLATHMNMRGSSAKSHAAAQPTQAPPHLPQSRSCAGLIGGVAGNKKRICAWANCARVGDSWTVLFFQPPPLIQSYGKFNTQMQSTFFFLKTLGRE